MGRYKETVIHIVGAALVLCIQYELSAANVIGLGACPSYNPTFTGVADPFVPGATLTTAVPTQTWYLHRRYPSFHSGLTCVQFVAATAQTAAPFTNTVTITGKKPINKKSLTITGTISQRAAANFYNWDAVFTSTGSTLSNLPTSLVVVAYDTANSNYLVLYGCIPYGIFNKQFSWVLTSSQSSTDVNIASALNAASIAGIPISKYVTVPQDFC